MIKPAVLKILLTFVVALVFAFAPKSASAKRGSGSHGGWRPHMEAEAPVEAEAHVEGYLMEVQLPRRRPLQFPRGRTILRRFSRREDNVVRSAGRGKHEHGTNESRFKRKARRVFFIRVRQFRARFHIRKRKLQLIGKLTQFWLLRNFAGGSARFTQRHGRVAVVWKLGLPVDAWFGTHFRDRHGRRPVAVVW